MMKKDVKQLVAQSYTDGQLDENKVQSIAERLSRKALKQYLKALKQYQNAQRVLVTLPIMPTDEEKKRISELFPGKQIVYLIDPALVAGVRIVDRDEVYDLNLKNRLQTMVDAIAD